MAERLRATIADEISTPNGSPVRVTASLGIAVAPKAGIATELDLVEAADRGALCREARWS